MTKKLKYSQNRGGCDFISAAITVLTKESRPLSLQEITEKILSQGLVASQGKTPQNTLSAAIVRKDKRRSQLGELPIFRKIVKGKKITFDLYKQ